MPGRGNHTVNNDTRTNIEELISQPIVHVDSS